ncbi:hypothetical protein NEOLEDRAFT_251585 [Neolentinus lepideus HHB14362 ss-1]|uniref:Uncharacterized protein n=1 Tax=Neolentinus lepideus HHB14362 ss-1 TaxID=1314782 RepID=A0A165T9J5_9AGAM|nr:hypothetical protein NEOLEDRAFT_251585 [Neolentinus lepideus HHB14362 ss-1]
MAIGEGEQGSPTLELRLIAAIRDFDIPSTASSPLTTLSELDMDDIPSSTSQSLQHDDEDMRIAELLCGLRVTATQSSEAPSSPCMPEPSESSVDSNVDTANKRQRTVGPSQKAAVAKASEPRKTERRRGRPSTSAHTNGTTKVEQDDTDYIPSVGPGSGKVAQNSLPKNGQIAETESSVRPRRSGRVPQPRRRSPLPSRVASLESLTVTPDRKTSPSEKAKSHLTPPAAVADAIPVPVPASASGASNHGVAQSNPPQSQSLKIRLPRLNSLSISSISGRSAPSTSSSQPSANDSTPHIELRKGQTTEARSRRTSHRRTSTAASAASTPSPSKLAGKNIAV